jgi:hypothetical protein
MRNKEQMRRDGNSPVASAAILASLCLVSLPARAFVLSEDEIEDTSTEAGVVARSFGFVFAGDTLAPPLNAEDANPSASSILDLRSYFSYRSSHWRLTWHQTSYSVVRSHQSLGSLALGRGMPPPRWLPLRADAADTPTLHLGTEADWAYAAYDAGRVTLTLGRQPITLGRGRLFHPWDVVSSFVLTEVDREYKRGADAARIDVSPSSSTTFTVLGTAGALAGENGISRRGSSVAVQGKQDWDRGQFSALAAFVRNDFLVGYGALWDLGKLDLYAEATATWVQKASLSSPAVAGRGAPVARALAGATLHPASHVTVVPEVYYDGFGAQRPRDYLSVAASERVAVGEQIVLGRLYAAVTADWEAHPSLRLTALALSNLLDASALVSVALSYDASANTRIAVGGYLPVGRAPRTGAVVEPRSEYGLYPSLAFAELRIAL